MNIDRSRLGALFPLLLAGVGSAAGCSAAPDTDRPEARGEASQAIATASRTPGGAHAPVKVSAPAVQATPPPAPPPLDAWPKVPGLPVWSSNMMLLTDGRVMSFAYAGYADEATNRRVDVLTPSASGSYEAGAWKPAASMHDSRLFFGSHVLPDGRVVVIGGESGTGGGKGEVYDPVADTWSVPFLVGSLDTETALLPSGDVYVAWSSNIYAPSSNTVRPGAAYPDGAYDEAGFVLLPDQTFLTIPLNEVTAYRYVPAAGGAADRFVPAGRLPANLYDGKGEIGPGVLLPGGKVFWLGGNGKTALYTPPASASDPGSWAAGPDIPDGRVSDDAPAVVLRNGHVLFVADLGGNDYTGPTYLYEYDPDTNLMSQGALAFGDAAMNARMLALPTGQVLLVHLGEASLYTPPPGGDAWAPAIRAIAPASGGTYELTGTNLHGVSEGAAYGDDAEMATNFPLVRLDCGGTVTYAPTSGWAPAVVGQSAALQTTRFTIPNAVTGSCSLAVVANGIPSAPRAVTVTNGVLDPTPGYLSGIWAIPTAGPLGDRLRGVTALDCADRCDASSSCTGFYAFTDWDTCQLYGSDAVSAGRVGPWSNVEMHWKKPDPDPTLGYRSGVMPIPDAGALTSDRLHGYQAYQCAAMCDARTDCVGFYAFTDWDVCQLYGAAARTSTTNGPWSNVKMYWKPE